MQPLPTAIAFFTICMRLSIGLPLDEPETKATDVVSEKHYISSSSNTLSSANGYHVSLWEANVNGNCVSSLKIAGNGIHKVIEFSCKNKPAYVINLNKTLLVGDEYFSDTPSVLVHLQNGKCEKEQFSKSSSTVTPMSDEECDKVKTKISILKEQQEKWNEWYKQQQQLAQQQLQQIQQNLQNLQQQLFGGFFFGWPLG